jgi:hypothetical protein
MMGKCVNIKLKALLKLFKPYILPGVERNCCIIHFIVFVNDLGSFVENKPDLVNRMNIFA